MRNTSRILALLLAVVLMLGSLPLSVFAAESSAEARYDTVIETELADYLLYQTTYNDTQFVGAVAKVSVYADTAANNKTVPKDTRDAIIYVKNWNGERIGTEDDVSIIRSYIEAPASVETKNKAIVIVLDYGYSGGEYAKNAVRGVIEDSVGAYRLTYLQGGNSSLNSANYTLGNLGKIKMNSVAVYALPEGYRVERDILFWETDYHASYGTMNQVLDAWNTEIANPNDNDYRQVYYDYYTEADFVKTETVDDGNGGTTTVTTAIDNRSDWDKADGATVGSPKHDNDGNVIMYDPDGNGVADKHGAPKVTRVKDCVKSDGTPMDYNVRLDIVHPSYVNEGDGIATPVVMVAGTQSHRMDNQMNGVRNYFGAFLFGGYTGVVYDYAYIPTARQDHYGYNDKYGEHGYNAAKWARAAVRCVRYYAETFGYSDELMGVMGISKGTPTASIICANNNELVQEKANYPESKNGTLFEGRTADGVENLYQPFSTYEGGYDGKGGNISTNPVAKNTGKTGAIDSNVTVGYAAAGDGIDWQYQTSTNLHKHIQTYGTVPMVLSCGESDPYGCYNRWFPLLDYKAENANNIYFAMQMEDKGHEYPNGIDPIRDYDRYTYFYKFFDAYLLPASEYAPSVAYITPKTGSEGVSYENAIEVQLFANTGFDVNEVAKNVTVKSESGKTVNGSWSTVASEMSNLFTFVPERIEIGTTYTVTVSANLKDNNGVALEEGKSVTFTTEGLYSSEAVADTYVSAAEPDKCFINEDKIVIDPTTSTEKIALITFKKDILARSGDLVLALPEITGAMPKLGVFVIDGYSVNTNTTYNSVKSYLDKAVEVNNVAVADGVARINATLMLPEVSSDEFTVALRYSSEEAPHYFYQDFSGTLNGVNGGTTNATVLATVLEKEGMELTDFRHYICSKYYDYSVGYNGGVGGLHAVTDSERGAVVKIDGANERYRLHNSISSRTLTEDDIGRTFKVSFWIKAEKTSKATTTTTSLTYGLMRPRTGTISRGGTINFNDSNFNTWIPITYTVKVDEAMLTDKEYSVETNQEAMVSFQSNGNAGYNYYIDDVVVEEVVSSISFGSMEASVRPAFIFSTKETDPSKPFGDTYVSTLFADTNYGSSTVLKVNSGENTHIALISFSSAALSDANQIELTLPTLNQANMDVKLSVISGLIIDEEAVTYNNIKTELAKAVSVGEYTITSGDVKLDLSAYADELNEKGAFTLVIEAADKADNVLNIDFEEYEVDYVVPGTGTTTVTEMYYTGHNGDMLSSAAYLTVRGYNSPYTYGGTGNASDKYGFTIKQDADGNKFGVVCSSTTRYSFLNGLGYDAITSADVGKTYTFTFKARKHATVFNGISDAALSVLVRDLKNSKNLYEKKATLSNEWQTFSASYTIVEADVGTSRKAMFTLAFSTVKAHYDIDEVMITTSGGAAATFASSEHKDKQIEIFGENVTKYVSVADTYVSKKYPDKNFGESSVLMVAGGEDEAIALASFNTDTLVDIDYLSLAIPVFNDAYVPVDVSIIENYCIDENEVTYNNIQDKLAEKVSVGSYILRDGLVNIDLTSKINTLKKNTHFTVVITADEGTASHMLNIDFEEYETGTTLSMGQTSATNGYTTITTAYYMGDEDIIGVRGYNSFEPGDNKAFAIKEDEDGNKYAQMKPYTGAASRWGILNGFAHRDLTADDKGKTYLLTFKIRLAEGSPSGKITYGMRTWLSSGSAYSGSKSLTVTNNEWQECAVTYTIAEADLSRKILFTIEFNGTGGPTYEIDDVRVVRHSGTELDTGAFIGSDENKNENSSIRLYTINNEEYDNTPIADAYVTQGDGKGYGDGETLTLTGKKGDNAMIFTTFTKASLEGKKYLKLPAEGICDGQIISVAVVDNAIVDENILDYANGQIMVKDWANAKFVGRYTLNKESPYIDVSDIASLVDSGVFTLVIQADQKHEYVEDFEGTKTLIGTNNYNRVYNSSCIARTGSAGSTSHTIQSVTVDGVTSKVMAIASGGHRYKFYNSLSYDDITVLDMYRKYSVSLDYATNFVYEASSPLSFSLKAACSGNDKAYGPSMKTYNNTSYAEVEFTSNSYSNYSSSGKMTSDRINKWNSLSYIVAFDDAKCTGSRTDGRTAGEAAVIYQSAMFTIDTAKQSDSSKMYYIDNIRIIEMDGNEGVTTSTFASRESGETFSFVAMGAETDVTLDQKVTVIEANVVAGKSGITDVLTLVGDSYSETLVSVDNESGDILVGFGGTKYALCDSYGVKYNAKEGAKVVAIFDNTNGSVRYAVNGNLAYYLDGEEAVNTYGTKLGNAGVAGNFKLGFISENDGATASDINTFKVASEAPVTIGTQTKYVDYSIRIVSAVDMLYYSQVGFIAEYGDHTPVTSKSNVVYSSISANDKTVTAEELGVGYLMTVVINNLANDSEIDGKIFNITPVAYVDEVEIRGETITYRISCQNNTISVSEVTE